MIEMDAEIMAIYSNSNAVSGKCLVVDQFILILL